MNHLLLSLIFVVLLLTSFFAMRSKGSSAWKPIVAGVAFGGVGNVLLCYAFNTFDVVKYQPEYFSAASLGGLPIEQILLSFLLPFAFIIIYRQLNGAFPVVKTDKYSLSVSNLIMGLSIAMIFFAYNKLFAVVTFSLLLLTLFYLEYKSRLRFMLQFYRSYAISLVPFLLIFIPANLLSMYKYTVGQTIEFKIAYIPFESYFCFLWAGLITITAYELSKRRV